MKALEKSEIKKLAEELMKAGPEGSKVEFKRWAKDGELAKEISAIANTDGKADNAFLQSRLGGDFGILLLGVDNSGQLVGIPQENDPQAKAKKWKTGWVFKDDNDLSSTLTAKLRSYVHPVPPVTAFGFDDAGKRWVAVLVYPSEEQPHTMRKQSGDAEYQEGEWFVKSGTNVVRAGHNDYQRVLGKAVKRALAPYEGRLQGLERRVDYELRDVSGFVEQLRGLLIERGFELATAAPDLAGPPAKRLRAYRRSMSDPVRGALEDAFAELEKRLHELNLPWHSQDTDAETLRGWIEKVEEATYETARAVGEVVAVDQEGQHAEYLVELLVAAAEARLAAKGSIIGDYWEGLQHYPFALLTLAVAVVARSYQRGAYLLALRAAKLENPVTRTKTSWLPEILNVSYWAGELLRRGLNVRYCDPVATRLMVLLLENPGLVRELVPRRTAHGLRELYYQAELLLAMISIVNAREGTHGSYLYANSAREDLCALFEASGDLLKKVFEGRGRKVARRLWSASASLPVLLCPVRFGKGEAPGCLDP